MGKEQGGFVYKSAAYNLLRSKRIRNCGSRRDTTRSSIQRPSWAQTKPMDAWSGPWYWTLASFSIGGKTMGTVGTHAFGGWHPGLVSLCRAGFMQWLARRRTRSCTGWPTFGDWARAVFPSPPAWLGSRALAAMQLGRATDRMVCGHRHVVRGAPK